MNRKQDEGVAITREHREQRGGRLEDGWYSITRNHRGKRVIIHSPERYPQNPAFMGTPKQPSYVEILRKKKQDPPAVGREYRYKTLPKFETLFVLNLPTQAGARAIWEFFGEYNIQDNTSKKESYQWEQIWIHSND